MAEKINFGIIGCGSIFPKHLKSVLENPDANLIAVCDVVKEKADKFAKEGDCKAYYDYKELIQDPDIDVVSICTPSGLHCEMAVAAMKAKKTVLCEKPMTLNVIDAEKIVEANKETGQRFFLVKQNRFNPPIKVLKEAFKKGQLGDVYLLNATVYWNRNKDYFKSVDWRGTNAMDGGALFNQSSHFLDLMIWLGGEVSSVYAVMKNVAHPEIETEDLGIIIIKFKNGAIGTLQYTTAVYEKNFEGTLGVLGTKGTVKIGGKYINELEFWNVEGVPKPELEVSSPPNDYGSYQGSMSNHDKVYQNIIDCIRSGEGIAATSAAGLFSVEVMQAAHLSALKNKEIFFPLSKEDHDFKLDELKGRPDLG